MCDEQNYNECLTALAEPDMSSPTPAIVLQPVNKNNMLTTERITNRRPSLFILDNSPIFALIETCRRLAQVPNDEFMVVGRQCFAL
jgi:hypothetical protein